MTHFNHSQLLDHIVQDLTGGRPFVFTVMPYRKHYAIYDRFKAIVEKEFGLTCLRADDVKLSGHDLLSKIHELIERAALVIAEISPNEPDRFSPNVYYEVGYAVAKQKSLLLIAEEGTTIPIDLKGLGLIEYGGSASGMQHFDHEFRQHLRQRLGTRLALLRDLLEGTDPTPAYIAASPKHPTPQSRIEGHAYEERTFGDNLGVRGLLSAFGAILGERAEVELISSQFHAPDILERDINLYCIGSRKVNP